MSVNKYRPHVYVLPEDDANRQLANGFLLHPDLLARNIQVLPEAGGWREVLTHFKSNYAGGMERYEQRLMVLLIDFDGDERRLSEAQACIPPEVKDRVFIVGALTRPEGLRAQLGSYETIGLALAKDCRENTNATWGSELLRHNETELRRLRERVLPVLFARIGAEQPG